MGWSSSEDIIESSQTSNTPFSQRFGGSGKSSRPGGIVYKNIMAKTRREKGKESELQVCYGTKNIGYFLVWASNFSWDYDVFD